PNFVVLREEELRQVRTILPRDSGDECALHSSSGTLAEGFVPVTDFSWLSSRSWSSRRLVAHARGSADHGVGTCGAARSTNDGEFVATNARRHQSARLRVVLVAEVFTMPNYDIKSKIENKSANIVVVGIGYVGLPLVVEFARAGYR